MCTVTYLPLKSGFIITSNRDERLLRKTATAPQVVSNGKAKILFPRDGEAGGTWIATAENGRTVCLLNGAFVPHHHQPPYRKSRGLVVLDFFETNSVFDFKEQYNLQGIEPFTMLVVEDKKLYELRWDGNGKYFKALEETKPQILCSVTLYTDKVITMRQQWFADWLKTHAEYTIAEILRFHLFAGEGDLATQIRMSRAGIVQTVSITCVQQQADKLRMYYSDVQGDKDFYFGAYSFSKESEGLSISA